MLNTLDVVIAFAVIMTVLSLLITIVVQMVSAGLSLRGKNLANALALTFQTIDPNIGEHAHSLAAQILRDPIFSDSILRSKSRRMLDAAAQAFIDAERKLKQATTRRADDPNRLQAVADAQAALATAEAGVKERPVKANRKKQWGFWSWPWGGGTQLGSAIRPGEVYRVLNELKDMSRIGASLRDIPPELGEKAHDLIEALKEWDQPALESRGKLAVISQVSQLFTTPGQQQAVLDSLENFGATVERATTQAYDRFQRWFGSAQDRAEQWFQMHVRMVTIVMAILAAFLLQLDTIELFHQLRDRPVLVDALVKSGSGVVDKGGKILDPADTSAYSTYQLWLTKHPEFELKPLPVDGTPAGYHNALQALLKEKSAKPEDMKAWLDDYDAMRVKGTEDFLKRRQESSASLKEEIEKAGFDLVPAPLFRRWQDPHRASGFWPQLWPHLFGILLSAGLLTLGAPFWFNLLKNLMNLRPAVATLIEKRPQSAPALPAAPATPPSSS